MRLMTRYNGLLEETLTGGLLTGEAPVFYRPRFAGSGDKTLVNSSSESKWFLVIDCDLKNSSEGRCSWVLLNSTPQKPNKRNPKGEVSLLACQTLQESA